MLSYAYDIACMWAHSALRMIRHPNGFHVDKVLVFDESENPATMYEHAPTDMTVKQLKEYVALQHYRSKFVMSLTGRSSDVSSETTTTFISLSVKSWR